MSKKKIRVFSGSLSLGWFVALMLAVFMAALSILLFPKKNDKAQIEAARITRALSSRMSRLEQFMYEAADADKDVLLNLKGIPDDMVVYRYISDTLQSWCNQFTLDNDDIKKRVYVQQFTDTRFNLVSPLADVGESPSYVNMGPKWYILKALNGPQGVRVIGGLEVGSTYGRGSADRRVMARPGFAVHPVSYSGGVPVYVEGVPLLKVIREYQDFNVMAPSLFSPNVYAGSFGFFTLGNILLTGILIFLAVLVCFRLRRRLWSRMCRDGAERILYAGSAFIIAAMVFIILYIHLTYRSIIINSNINLELYKLTNISRFTIYVYGVYLLLFSTLPMLVQLLSPLFRKCFGIRLYVFSRMGRVLFSALTALYLVITAAMLGFSREESKMETLSKRLAVDRNLAFELQLKAAEIQIISDQAIPYHLEASHDYRMILHRIIENHLPRVAQNYDVNVLVLPDSTASPEKVRYFEERIQKSQPVSDGSHFLHLRTGNGRSQYTGDFPYLTSRGLVHLLITIDSREELSSRGYGALLGESAPGSAIIPAHYSYGRFMNGNLVGYRGSFSYTTVLAGELKTISDRDEPSHMVSDGYMHFVTKVSDDECIVVSRPVVDVLHYVVTLFLVLILIYLLLGIPVAKTGSPMFQKNYYKSRINSVLFFSLFFTLVSLTVISVLFVYRRNEANVRTQITGKISTIQSLVQANTRFVESLGNVDPGYLMSMLEDVGRYTKCDITLFSNSGKVMVSTYPEIFGRMIVGPRVNEEAYRNIMYRRKSFYLHREKIAGTTCYAMYAPVFNENGKMLAIAAAPYTDAETDLKYDALFHSIMIITVFVILLLFTRFVTISVVDKMFRPLADMSRKMDAAGKRGMEYIIYERDDEISSLVYTYNRMVHDLSESGKQMAQMERDKLWTSMARQVAHDIKNILTPIKLQIQRLIRLKSQGNPAWQERMDEILPGVMDNIDMLSEVSMEFMTIAGVPYEQMEVIDLVALADSQVRLFDADDGIEFKVFGLESAMVLGPKKQLTRVFNNLLSNSVQAIRGGGCQSSTGRVWVSVRNSAKDGFFDVSFEDNGPGVLDENRSKLFQPRFTTKSSGTGLGLAVSKTLLERCGADISYARSYALKGAGFLIRYPVKK